MPEAQVTAPAADTSASTPVERNEKGQFTTAPATREPVSKQPDAEERYARIGKALEKFREAGSDDNEETTPEAEAPEETEQPAEEAETQTPAAKEADTATEEAAETKPATDEPAKEAAAEVTPASTLPAAHVRSLKAFGLTDAEIAKTTPEVALALHNRRNQEITRWAEAGRKAQAQTQQPPAVGVNPTATPPVQPAAPAPTAKVDLKKLEEMYGADEPLIQQIRAQEAELAEFRQFRTAFAQQQEQQRLAAIVRDVDTFFGAKEMAPHHGVYGTASASLTPEQEAKRVEVLKLADAIIGGARQQGVELPLQEALQHAFDSVSAPQVKEAARQEVVAAVQKRAKGLTLKPGGKTAPKPQPSAKAELLANTRTRLKKVFAGS